MFYSNQNKDLIDTEIAAVSIKELISGFPADIASVKSIKRAAAALAGRDVRTVDSASAPSLLSPASLADRSRGARSPPAALDLRSQNDSVSLSSLGSAPVLNSSAASKTPVKSTVHDPTQVSKSPNSKRVAAHSGSDSKLLVASPSVGLQISSKTLATSPSFLISGSSSPAAASVASDSASKSDADKGTNNFATRGTRSPKAHKKDKA